MDLESLAAEIAAMKAADEDRQRESQFRGFMDKYGTRFSGDEGMGVAILGELGRRGVDTSAADEAVQDILDQIRAEATAILDKIKMDERTVSGLMDQVATVQEAVNAATGAAPGADVPVGTPMAPPPGDMPMPEGAGMDPSMEPTTVDTTPPEDMNPEAEGAAEMGEGAVEMGEGAAEMGEGAAEEEMAAPPAEVPSDVRIKNLRARVAGRKVKPASTGWKPPAHLLAGVQRGF